MYYVMWSRGGGPPHPRRDIISNEISFRKGGAEECLTGSRGGGL